jgi:hypothetical protein
MARGHRRTRTTWKTPTGTWKQRKRSKPKAENTNAAKAWWWTVTQQARGECSECLGPFSAGQVIAYNRDAGESLCELCTDRRSLSPQPSRRFREFRAQQRA